MGCGLSQLQSPSANIAGVPGGSPRSPTPSSVYLGKAQQQVAARREREDLQPLHQDVTQQEHAIVARREEEEEDLQPLHQDVTQEHAVSFPHFSACLDTAIQKVDNGLLQAEQLRKKQQHFGRAEINASGLQRLKGFLDTVKEDASAAPRAWMLGRGRTVRE